MGVIFIFGPLIGFITFPAAIRYKTSSPFERILKFNLFGILAFFFLFTFRGRIETNWVAQALIPLTLLSYAYLRQQPKWRRVLLWIAAPSFLVLLLLRIHLAFPFLPEQVRSVEYADWSTYIEKVKDAAQGRHIMGNSYQRASKLAFYLNKPVHSLHTGGRRSQYNLWRLDQQVERQSITLFSKIKRPCTKHIGYPGHQRYYYLHNEYFVSYAGVKISFLQDTITVAAGQRITLPIEISGLRPIHLDPEAFAGQPTWISYHIYQAEECWVWDGLCTDVQKQAMKSGRQNIAVLTPPKPGFYLIAPRHPQP